LLLAGPCGAPEVQRLKTRAQFEAVMAGTTVSRTAHFALHRAPLDTPPALATGSGSAGPASEESPPITTAAGPESPGYKPLFAVRDAWVGALVPKRWAKRAVTRNAIKRQIYTVSKAIEPPLPLAAHVVRLRASFDRAEFISASSPALKRAVRGELQELFARAAP
jgi:ribonuclease P protein component